MGALVPTATIYMYDSSASFVGMMNKYMTTGEPPRPIGSITELDNHLNGSMSQRKSDGSIPPAEPSSQVGPVLLDQV